MKSQITGISADDINFKNAKFSVYYADNDGIERKQNFEFFVCNQGLLNIRFENCQTVLYGPNEARIKAKEI